MTTVNDIPMDLLPTILTFCDIKTILNCRLVSRKFYHHLRNQHLWQQLMFYLLTRTELSLNVRNLDLSGLYFERVFFNLLRILSSRDDLENALRESCLTNKLQITWSELGMIVRQSPLITPIRRSTIFNLEGSVELKRTYVQLLSVKGLNFMHVLR